MPSSPLRIGFVPEHFSTPLHFAQIYFGLDALLVKFLAGTGAMITALRAGDIDMAIGLTEAWVTGLGKAGVEGDGGYRIVGTYVESSLRWAISVGKDRPDITSVESLKGAKLGVSRIGSGSFVMAFYLAKKYGWLPDPFKDIVPLENFQRLRDGVNSDKADFFMWEHFTTKKYYDSGEIRHVDDIDTPWSSWKIVSSTRLIEGEEIDERVPEMLQKLNQGIDYFNKNPDEAVAYISTHLDYSKADAQEWMKTVKFPVRTEGVKPEVVQSCVDTLRSAGVITEGKGISAEGMVHVLRHHE